MSDATSKAQLAMKKSPRGIEGGPSVDQGTKEAEQAYQVAVRKRIQEIGIKEKEFYYIAERSLKKGECHRITLLCACGVSMCTIRLSHACACQLHYACTQ